FGSIDLARRTRTSEGDVTRGVRERVVELHDDEIEGDVIVTPLRDDDVCPALGRLHELEVHGTHGPVVLLAHRGEATAALLDVAPNAPKGADVRVGVDED